MEQQTFTHIPPPVDTPKSVVGKKKIPILLVSVFVIAICGILYELLISSITSYFQGSSILHFSIVIGLFLSFMGIGSYLSRYIQKHLLLRFIQFEILLSIVGGVSSLLLYFAFSLTPYFYLFAFLLIAILGSIIGVEIPILTRIVRRYEPLKDAMAKVLSFDYLGSLLASLAFPLVLLPFLGIMKTAFVIGLINLFVAITNTWIFRKELGEDARWLFGVCAIVLMGLSAGLMYSFQLTSLFEKFLYQDEIILTKQSPYQRIVVTRWQDDTRLYINGNLQFSSRDEYRYHEGLVHVPMALTPNKERILILGGGDGLAIRELLKYKEVKHIDLVDLDKAITDLGKDNAIFTSLNKKALQDDKVDIYNVDGYKFIEESSDLYDLIIIDLPDPHDTALGKLYSAEFYGLIHRRLSAGGVVVTQSTSPYYAPKAFWCIYHTLHTKFPEALPYTLQVPAFGQWGFNLGIKAPGSIYPDTARSARALQAQQVIQKNLLDTRSQELSLRYLTNETLPGLFSFDGDTKEMSTEINKLENQMLIQYYEQSWNKWKR